MPTTDCWLLDLKLETQVKKREASNYIQTMNINKALLKAQFGLCSCACGGCRDQALYEGRARVVHLGAPARRPVAMAAGHGRQPWPAAMAMALDMATAMAI